MSEDTQALPPMGPPEKRFAMQAQVWWRESTQEWVLSIYGTINDTFMECRHPAPGHLAPEDVPGLGHVYDELDNRDAQIAAWLRGQKYPVNTRLCNELAAAIEAGAYREDGDAG